MKFVVLAVAVALAGCAQSLVDVPEAGTTYVYLGSDGREFSLTYVKVEDYNGHGWHRVDTDGYTTYPLKENKFLHGVTGGRPAVQNSHGHWNEDEYEPWMEWHRGYGTFTERTERDVYKTTVTSKDGMRVVTAEYFSAEDHPNKPEEPAGTPTYWSRVIYDEGDFLPQRMEAKSLWRDGTWTEYGYADLLRVE